MEKNKIGLCMTFQGTNYGQLLQAYALQQKIDSLGYETEIIRYHSGKNKGIKISFASACVAVHTALKKLARKKHNDEILDENHKANIAVRNEVSNYFRNRFFHNIVEINGYTDLVRKSGEYGAVVVGSDQVWLPEIAVTNFYTLRFAQEGVRRISYATSMGVSFYPRYLHKAAAEYWSKIDYISVRENQAKQIIKQISNVDAKVVADPTYLLTSEEWEERIPTKRIIEPNYVLCYFLGDSEPIKRFAREFANKKGLRLVSILSNECNSDDYEFADEVLIGKSPEEFVNLIRNAKYVLTDSFHGLAFSVINEKQFYVFYRTRADAKQSRNSRIDNILKIWGLEDRLIKNPERLVCGDSIIDYQKVTQKRINFREDSLNFLKEALENK